VSSSSIVAIRTPTTGNASQRSCEAPALQGDRSLMTCEVVLTKDAERDLEDTYRYIAEHDSPGKADQVLDRLLQATEALRTLPDRGSCPNELRSLGISEYRQVFFKPYRLICRAHVVIYVVADGRRDMQSLLMRRLLGA
jgi:toxin ParE1/3/4